ncbi:baseplate J/gp47 family protein [Chengkuizengella sp. SCS-71B]|uniref:baseplate J/gp47 family protein n=1 Tax=Chengkuizengella sp. SCS-71B TaxID=3115290 RepID=UPI0032C23F93
MSIELPDFLQDQTEENIHQRMLEQVPTSIDTSEGELYYTLTRPTAIEKAEMIEMQFKGMLEMAFPQFASSTYLDYHAEMKGVKRKQALKATGMICFKGAAGTFIPAGTVAATASDGHVSSIEFVTTEEATVPDTGEVEVQIEAIEAGTIGNVVIGAIQILSSSVNGIVHVENREQTSGGTEAENDESLRLRILEENKNQSYVGNMNDYLRWAQEVDGVGQVFIFPELDGPGTVEIVVLDANGNPGNEALIQDVQEKINENAGIGVKAIVKSPTEYPVHLSFTLTLYAGTNETEVKENIIQNIRTVISNIEIGGSIIHSKIGAAISFTAGVLDYSNLLINGSENNIALPDSNVAVLGDVSMNE